MRCGVQVRSWQVLATLVTEGQELHVQEGAGCCLQQGSLPGLEQSGRGIVGAIGAADSPRYPQQCGS